MASIIEECLHTESEAENIAIFDALGANGNETLANKLFGDGLANTITGSSGEYVTEDGLYILRGEESKLVTLALWKSAKGKTKTLATNRQTAQNILGELGQSQLYFRGLRIQEIFSNLRARHDAKRAGESLDV